MKALRYIGLLFCLGVGFAAAGIDSSAATWVVGSKPLPPAASHRVPIASVHHSAAASLAAMQLAPAPRDGGRADVRRQ